MNFLVVLELFDEAGDRVKFLTVVLLYVGLPVVSGPKRMAKISSYYRRRGDLWLTLAMKSEHC